MSEYTVENIEEGKSWGCKFKTVQMIDDNGELVNTNNIQPGSPINGTPGIYESIGLIETRDVQKKLIQVRDIKSNKLFTVHWNDAWDIDVAEYKE